MSCFENPGALAGATGAGNSEQAFKSKAYRLRAERATTLCLAIASCDPEDAAPILWEALDDFHRQGLPSAPLTNLMNHATDWANWATERELKAYAGMGFHGRATKQGTVIYIAGEGHGGLARRRMAWEAERGLTLAERRAPFFTSTVAGDFLDSSTTHAVIAAITATAKAEGPPALIVVDTLARNFGGGDENSTSDMNRFVAAIDLTKDQWPSCTALIVHHTGHGNKARSRGSIALTGAVDSEYRVEKEGMVLTVINTKMKDAPPPAPIAFDMVEMQLGPKMTSLALRETEVVKRPKKVSGQAQIALQAFGDALAEHGEKRSGANFPHNRRCLSLDKWREYCDRHALSGSENPTTRRTAFHKAKATLHGKGIIRIVDDYAWRVEE